MLNHTAGLHNALSDQFKDDPFIMCNWDEILKQIAMAAPDTSPGTKQIYHALTYGWLCGGIIEVYAALCMFLCFWLRSMS